MDGKRNQIYGILNDAARLSADVGLVKRCMYCGGRSAALPRVVRSNRNMHLPRYTEEEAYASLLALIVRNSLDFADAAPVFTV